VETGCSVKYSLDYPNSYKLVRLIKLMAVRYKHKPKDFEEILNNKEGFSSTLGKSEYEQIARGIIEESFKKGDWVQKEISDVILAEGMADRGLLFRIRPPIKKPRYDECGWLCFGIYEITNEALGMILNP